MTSFKVQDVFFDISIGTHVESSVGGSPSTMVRAGGVLSPNFGVFVAARKPGHKKDVICVELSISSFWLQKPRFEVSVSLWWPTALLSWLSILVALRNSRHTGHSVTALEVVHDMVEVRREISSSKS
jgi:hypothetical protein